MNMYELLMTVSDWNGRSLGSEEYVTFGDAARAINKVMVSWCVNDQVIDAAVQSGCDAIVHHESLLHPYPLMPGSPERPYLSWPANWHKLSRLDRAGLVCARLHGTIDELVIFATEAETLDLERIESKRETYYDCLFRSPTPTFGELVRHVKARWPLPGLRVWGDPNRKIRRVGLAWGGMGLFVNVGYLQRLKRLGADAVICGESDSMGIHFCVESDLPVIETSHEASENAGLEKFSALLSERTGLPTAFYPVTPQWRIE